MKKTITVCKEIFVLAFELIVQYVEKRRLSSDTSWFT